MVRFILLFSCALGLLAQPSPNSVSQSIATASVLAPITTVAIKGVNNIGQNSHQLFLYTADVTATSCSTALGFAGTAYLQGSIDNVNFIQIGPSISNQYAQNTNVNPLIISAIGLYPYLQVVYHNLGPTLCSVTIWYTGSISPQAYSSSPRTVNDQFLFNPFTVSASGDTTVANSCLGGVTGSITVLYGLYVYNPSAANSIVVQGGATGAAKVIITLTTFAQGAQFNGMPFTGKPYYTAYPLGSNPATQAQNSIIVHLVNATEVDGYVVYRCE